MKIPHKNAKVDFEKLFEELTIKRVHDYGSKSLSPDSFKALTSSLKELCEARHVGIEMLLSEE